MSDETEELRRHMQHEINTRRACREELENEYGQVWDTVQLSATFEVIGFMAPMVVVRRKADGHKGSLLFQHEPRLYFGFVPE